MLATQWILFSFLPCSHGWEVKQKKQEKDVKKDWKNKEIKDKNKNSVTQKTVVLVFCWYAAHVWKFGDHNI